jgi:hypothetical protein
MHQIVGFPSNAPIKPIEIPIQLPCDVGSRFHTHHSHACQDYSKST